MFKKLWEWIKRPHGFPLVLFYLITVVFVICTIVFAVIWQGTVYYFVAYIFYAFAAVTLGYTVYTLVVLIPKAKRKLTEKLKTNKFAANVLEDYDFKTKFFALISFGITIAFAVMNLVSAVRYRLIWYGALAAYYFVLILFRGGILYANKKCAHKYADKADVYEKCKLQIYLASGAFLIILEFAMMGAVTQMMLSERPTQSGEIMAITNASYTFYKIIMAICNLVKARKLSDPVTQSLRNLNFADACMSVVSLTVLMISTFDGGDPAEALKTVKCVVGFAVCAIIVALAVFMIIRADKKLKSLTANGEFTDERTDKQQR